MPADAAMSKRTRAYSSHSGLGLQAQSKSTLVDCHSPIPSAGAYHHTAERKPGTQGDWSENLLLCNVVHHMHMNGRRRRIEIVPKVACKAAPTTSYSWDFQLSMPLASHSKIGKNPPYVDTTDWPGLLASCHCWTCLALRKDAHDYVTAEVRARNVRA